MSEERIERRLLERFRANYLEIVEAFNRHDFEAAFAGTPPDFVFDISGVGLYERAAGMIRGSSGVVMHSREELIAFIGTGLRSFRTGTWTWRTSPSRHRAWSS